MYVSSMKMYHSSVQRSALYKLHWFNMNGQTHLFYYAIVNYCMVSFFQAECYIFNSESVIVIGGEAYKNSYFSYSLLLQSGEGGTS